MKPNNSLLWLWFPVSAGTIPSFLMYHANCLLATCPGIDKISNWACSIFSNLSPYAFSELLASFMGSRPYLGKLTKFTWFLKNTLPFPLSKNCSHKCGRSSASICMFFWIPWLSRFWRWSWSSLWRHFDSPLKIKHFELFKGDSFGC